MAQLRRYQTGGGGGATCVSRTASIFVVISVAGCVCYRGRTETICGADLEKQFDTTNRSLLFVGRLFLSCIHLCVSCLSAPSGHAAERVLLAAACCDSSQNFDRQSFGQASITRLYSAWLPILSVMVRFHWHVEQGMSAYMPPDGITLQKDSKVQQASCEIEVSSHSCPHSCCPDADFSLRRSSSGSWPEGNITSYSHTAPKLFEARQGIKQRCHIHMSFNTDYRCKAIHVALQVKEVGIVLGHGSNAADWNGKFLTELAAALASQGKQLVFGM